LQYIEQQGLLNFPTVCPKCSSKVAHRCALPLGQEMHAPPSGLPDGTTIFTDYRDILEDVYRPVHSDCLKVCCKGKNQHKASTFTGTSYENVKLKKNSILCLMYLFVMNIEMVHIESLICLHQTTISQYLKFLRLLLQPYWMKLKQL